MFEEMLGAFLSSPQGQSAAQALAARGIGQGQIQQILSAAFPAATSSLGKQARASRPDEPELGMFDLLGGHPGQAFLIGAAASMLRGEGLVDAAQDGAMSVVGAHVAEVVASRVGLDRQMSSQVAAAVTPFIVGFVQEKLAGRPEVSSKRGAPSGGTWQDKFAAKHGGVGAPMGKPMQVGGAPMQGKPMPMQQPMQGKPMPMQQPMQGKPMPMQQPMQGKPMPMQGKPMPMQGKPMPQSPQGKPVFTKGR